MSEDKKDMVSRGDAEGAEVLTAAELGLLRTVFAERIAGADSFVNLRRRYNAIQIPVSKEWREGLAQAEEESAALKGLLGKLNAHFGKGGVS